MHSVPSVNPSSAPLPGPPAGLAFEMLKSKSNSLACPVDAESCLLPSTTSPRAHLNPGHLRAETGSDYAGLQSGVQPQTQPRTSCVTLLKFPLSPSV